MRRVGREAITKEVGPLKEAYRFDASGPAGRPGVPAVRTAVTVMAALLYAAGLAGGCTPNLATMEPARIVPEGHWQVSSGITAGMPVGDPLSAIEEIADIEGGEGASTMTPEQIRTLARGSSVIFIHPPGASAYLSVAYGVGRHFEIGMRGSADAARGWVRWQFLRVRPGLYGALGLGYATYFRGFPVEDYTDLARPVSFSRQEMDLPLQLGLSGKVGHVWFGPKLMVADYDVEESVCSVTQDGVCLSWGSTRVAGTATYIGGQLGGAIGYKWIWLAAELSFMSLDVRADLDVDVAETQEMIDYQTEGWALSPSLGIITWF